MSGKRSQTSAKISFDTRFAGMCDMALKVSEFGPKGRSGVLS
jgi:hypothetical protein